VRGFLIGDHAHRTAAFRAEVGGLLREGRIRVRETVVDGIARAPEAFLALLRGDRIGKMVVRVGPDPAYAASVQRDDDRREVLPAPSGQRCMAAPGLLRCPPQRGHTRVHPGLGLHDLTSQAIRLLTHQPARTSPAAILRWP
jgi:hypothetical protein